MKNLYFLKIRAKEVAVTVRAGDTLTLTKKIFTSHWERLLAEERGWWPLFEVQIERIPRPWEVRWLGQGQQLTRHRQAVFVAASDLFLQPYQTPLQSPTSKNGNINNKKHDLHCLVLTCLYRVRGEAGEAALMGSSRTATIHHFPQSGNGAQKKFQLGGHAHFFHARVLRP